MIEAYRLLSGTLPTAVLIVSLAAPAGTRSRVESPGVAPGPQLLAGKDVGMVAADLQALVPTLMAKAHIPGLQIALIRDGRLAWRGSFGARDARSREAVTDDTVFEAASLTKPLFAYYVMKLADQGVLSLDRPLAGYLPPEKIVKFLGHPLDEKGFHRDWFEKATARQVLSHSSGFPHGQTGKPYPLLFEPGTQWKYSAGGYFFLQRVVEHLKGAGLDKLVQKEVLGPLGMTRSAMVWNPAFETMAPGHGPLGRPEPFNKRKEARAAASLYTTAGDYARFLCAVLNGEGLRPATFKEMLAPAIDMDKAKGLGWSLGFGTQSDGNGLALWQWGDQNGIYRAYTIAYPTQKSGVVYLTNSYFGLSISSELVARSVGGHALGSRALNYQPYDSPLLRFAWDLQEKGPAVVNDLDRVKRENPGMFRDEFGVTERQWLGALTTSLQREGMTKEALALLEYDVTQHPRSGRAAMSAADGCLRTGDRARAAQHLQRALEATEERVDAAVLKERLRYVAALDQPTPADLSGRWVGALWASDGRTIDLVTLVLEKHGNGYRGTLADTLGQIPAGTKVGDVRRFRQRENAGAHRGFPSNLLFDNVEPRDPSGNGLAFTVKVSGSELRVGTTIEGATLKGRWVDVWHRNNGALELAWAGR